MIQRHLSDILTYLWYKAMHHATSQSLFISTKYHERENLEYWYKGKYSIFDLSYINKSMYCIFLITEWSQVYDTYTHDEK